MFDQILAAARGLLEGANALRSVREARCEASAKYFEAIAADLSNLAAEVRAGDVNGETLTAVATHSKIMSDAVRNTLTLMKAEELIEKLNAALAAGKASRCLTATDAFKVEEAAGAFRALGAACRAHF